MRERTSLIKSYDEDDEDEAISIGYEGTAEQDFVLPERNWNSLVENYNLNNKRKFRLTPLQCKVIVEWTKKGVPTENVFKAHGISPFIYKSLLTEFEECEAGLQELVEKDALTEEETKKLEIYIRHPLRVLMSDIMRAEGISEVMDFEQFEYNAQRYPEVQLVKMKARFRKYFSEKETNSTTANVQIVIGGDWVSKI